MIEIRQASVVLHAHWSQGKVDLHGAKQVLHPEPGRYVFEGDFLGNGLMVNVEVDAPWRFEETACEVEICLTHPDYSCPDGDDAAWMNCKLVKRICHAPRWTPVVRDVADRSFGVEIWRAPLAPADGTKSVGETVLADVGFSVIAVVPA